MFWWSELIRYEARLARQSWHTTMVALGQHIWAAITVALVPVAVVILVLFVPAARNYLGENAVTIEIFIAFAGLLAIGISMLVLFIWHLIHAPLRDQQSLKGKIKELSGDLAALQEMFRPRISLSLEQVPVVQRLVDENFLRDRNRFWRIGVTNESNSTIKRCYGIAERIWFIKDDGSRLDMEDADYWPSRSLPLPFARDAIGGGGYEVDLPGDETTFLDYARIERASTLISPPSRGGTDGRPDWGRYHLPNDKVEFEIAVGSYDDPLMKARIRFLFEHDGDQHAVLTELPLELEQSMEGSPSGAVS